MLTSSFVVKTFQLSAISMALALAGCGGGGGGHNDTVQPAISTGMIPVTNNTTSTDATTTANLASVKTVQLVSSDATFPLTNNTTIALAVYALNSNNIGVANVPVSVQISDPAVTGVFSGTDQNLVTDATGKATIKLDINALTDTQKSYLKTNGVTVAATVGKATNSKVLKGVDASTSTAGQKYDVQAISLTKAFDKFNIKVGEKFTVTAAVLNSNNTGSVGVPVKFKLLEDPSTTGIYSVSDTSNVISNANGEATIELEVKSEAAKQKLIDNGFTLQATAQNTLGDTAVDKIATLTLKGQAPADTTTVDNVAKVNKVLITSSVNPFTLTAGTTVSVIANVVDASQGALANVPVTFNLPSLEQTGVANISGSTVTTDAKGQAIIQLEVKSLTATQRKYLVDNGLKVQATVPNGTTIAPLTIAAKDSVIQNTINSVAVTADNTNVYMSAGSKVQVTAIALDSNFGGLANQNLKFTLPDPSTTGLYNITGSSVITNAQGEATISLEVKSALTDAQKQQLKNGLVITVTSDNGKTGQIKLTGQEVNQVTVDKVNLTSNVTAIPMTIGSRFAVTATVADVNNGGIANTPVTFTVPSSADTGIVSLSGSTVTTDAQGAATIEFEVKSLTDAQKQKILAGFNVTANSNGKTAPVLTLKGDDKNNVNVINFVTDTNNIELKVGAKVKLTALVLNKDNGGIANKAVNFVISDTNLTGVFNNTGSVVTTNNNGEATIELEVKSLTDAQKQYLQNPGLKITATSDNVTKTSNVLGATSVVQSNVENVYLTTQYSAIKTEVGTKVNVTVLALDKNNGGVANAPVTVNITDPNLTGVFNTTGSNLTTNAQGEAVLTLEVKSLTDAQKQYLLNTGINISAYAGIKGNNVTIKGAGSNTNVVKQDLYNVFISPSKDQMRTGSDEMTVNIRVTDKSGGIKPNVPVILQLDNSGKYGLSLDKSSTLVTDENGLVTVKLIQNDIGIPAKLNHDTKLVVKVDDGVNEVATQTLPIMITGTAVQNASSSANTVSNNDVFNVTGTLVDGKLNPIANTTVELLNNGIATGITGTTNIMGQFTFTNISAQNLTADNAGNLNLSVKVSGGGVEQTINNILSIIKVAISDVSFEYENAANHDFVVNTIQKVTINLPSVVDGQTVYLSTSKGYVSNTTAMGTESRVSTPVSGGKAIFYIESTSPGAAKLTLDYPENQHKDDSINYVSISPAKLLLQTEKTVVATNGSTMVIAKILDANDAPVKNAIVSFASIQDASGGQLSASTAITDESGIARVGYYGGANPTAVDGVILRATVNSIKINGQETPVSSPLSVDKTLTVQNNAAYIGVSFADKLQDTQNHVYYIRNGSTYVTNSVGQPAANQPVTIALAPSTYLKGGWQVAPATSTMPARWIRNPSQCQAEDTNANNILDPGEDFNNNGQLDPINVATILAADGTTLAANQTVMTDATGKLDFTIRYPKQYAEWFYATVKVSTKVDGSEFVQTRPIDFPVLVDDVDISVPIRPNAVSPFGIQNCNMPN